jgi:hypothetical protein
MIILAFYTGIISMVMSINAMFNETYSEQQRIVNLVAFLPILVFSILYIITC